MIAKITISIVKTTVPTIHARNRSFLAIMLFLVAAKRRNGTKMKTLMPGRTYYDGSQCSPVVGLHLINDYPTLPINSRKQSTPMTLMPVSSLQQQHFFCPLIILKFNVNIQP